MRTFASIRVSRLKQYPIEVQGRRDSDFAKRMFTYNYRLFDRYARPIASLAVLADVWM